MRTPQSTRALYTPSSGLAEAVLRASPDPTCMLAFWLTGFDGVAEGSGELCVCEMFGDRIGRDRSTVNIGVKAKQDPRLHDDVHAVELALDAFDWHTYSVVWTPEQARFFVDDHLIRTVEQRLDHPLLVMVDLFEFPVDRQRDPAAYPEDRRSRERAWVPARPGPLRGVHPAGSSQRDCRPIPFDGDPGLSS